MFGKKRSWFQKNDKNFAERLREIFASDESSILVGAADDFGNLEKYTESAADDIRDYMMKSRREIETIIDYSRKYYDAYVTRPYIIYKDKAHAKNIFELFKQVWVGKRVLLVEGVMSRIGVGNDLFSSAKSVNRIICPQENCWDRYSAILECAKKYAENADIVCVSLGAAATVLAYDLAKEGYQAIDIGQIDNEYEWYLRKAEKRVSIPGKMVAEVDNKVSFCHDIQGYQEYIASVLEEVK
jgi:glycosyltransferase family protein